MFQIFYSLYSISGASYLKYNDLNYADKLSIKAYRSLFYLIVSHNFSGFQKKFNHYFILANSFKTCAKSNEFK